MELIGKLVEMKNEQLDVYFMRLIGRLCASERVDDKVKQ